MSSLGGSWHGVALGLGLHQGTPGGWQGPWATATVSVLASFHSPGATPTEASLAGKRQLPADRDAVCVSSGFPTPLGVFKMEGPAHGPLQPGRGSWGAGGSTSLQADLLCYL